MTHRASLPYGNNEFLIATDDGRVYDTAFENAIPMKFVTIQQAEEFAYHATNGFSPNCVICIGEARKPFSVADALRARLEELDAAWTAEIDKITADAIFAEMADLQAEIEKHDGAMDDFAEARIAAKYGSSL